MSKGIDIQFIRENYQRMSNDELIHTATHATGLTLETQEVIKDEIERRNLNPDIIKGVQTQSQSYTLEEIDEYCNLVRTLSCPTCGANTTMLNATLTSEVMSFIVFTDTVSQTV